MNIKLYIIPLLKYWWLIISAALIATVSSYYVTSQQPLIYQSRATLMVGRSFFEANPTGNDLYLGQQLATYYSDMGKRSEIRNAVMKALNVSWLPEYNVRPLPNSVMIEIIVVDTVPARAQTFANEIANQLVLISPTSNQNQGQERQDFINEQVSYLEVKIRETLSEISKAEKELSELNSAKDISDTRTRINALQSKLSQLQSNYASLISNTEQGAKNTLTIIERASLPFSPIGPNRQLTILLSAAIAAVVACGAAYLMELLDDTFKSSDEVSEMLKKPILATVPMNASELNGTLQKRRSLQDVRTRVAELVKRKKPVFSSNGTGKKALGGTKDSDGSMAENGDIFTFVATHPRSIVAEEFRLLRLNLDFLGVDRPLKKIFVTSVDAGEGKSYAAINLAIVMAQGGKRVVLIDADLRRPSIAQYLKINSKKGLSDLLRSNIHIQSVIREWEECKTCKISVIPAGITPPNPVDLLTSHKMEQVLNSIDEIADVVIIDGPPMPFSDTVALSKKVDGVLMVVSHAQTRRGLAQKMLKQFEQVGVNIIGIVYNKVPYRVISRYHQSYYSYNEVKTEPEFERAN